MNEDENIEDLKRNSLREKQKLFACLKTTTEKVLGQGSYGVWCVHGGLESLTNAIDKILKFGNKKQVGILGPLKDYWLFIRGLKWMEPALGLEIDYLSKLPASSPTKIKLESFKSRRYHRQPTLPTHGQQWIESSLKNGNLMHQLNVLTSDVTYLEDHYYDWSLLMDSVYLNAMIICIEALEKNSSAILANIPVELLVGPDIEIDKVPTNVRVHRGITNPDILVLTSKDSSEDTETLSDEKSDPLSVALSGFLETKNIPIVRRPSILSNDTNRTPPSGERMPQSFSSGSLHDNSQPSSSLNSNAKQRLFRECNVNYSATDGLEMSRKPLFDDGENFFENSSDLGFLIAREPSLFTRISPSSYDGTKSQYENNLQFPDLSNEITDVDNKLNENPIIHSSGLLPDIITSAEDSLSNPHKHSTSYQQSSGVFNKSSSSRESSNLTKHRRCRSDHITKIEGSNSNLEQNENIIYRQSIKPSSSMPTLLKDGTVLQTFSHNDDSNLPKSQSLMNYLKNQDLITCAELDKENAHFHFSELLIGAIEQMKCSMKKAQTKENETLDAGHHTYEIQGAEKSPQPRKTSNVPSTSLPFVNYNSSCSSVSSGLAASPADKDIMSMNETQHSAPIPETEIQRQETNTDSISKTLHGFGKNFGRFDSLRTAESIAIGLLQTFKDKPPIKLTDIEYLISEDDVPQELLPLPSSIAIDPDANHSKPEPGIRLRGNQEWAPPRPQIIFHLPKKLKLKVAMANQNFRCAGCGTQVNKAYIKRFRYCEYIGKYFCTCCHDNNLSVIPAYILQKFDFTKYKVSNFCFDFLNRINTEPLFHIDDINPSLYKKIKVLSQIRDLRVQLSILYKYIEICRFANSEPLENEIDDNESETQPLNDSLHLQVTKTFMPHIYGSDVHIYSIDDLENSKDILLNLKPLVENLSEHVLNCELCRMKGFVCEVCNKDNDIIFPHQSKTISCPQCRACYHKKCFTPGNCLKCQRIEKRKQLLGGKK